MGICCGKYVEYLLRLYSDMSMRENNLMDGQTENLTPPTSPYPKESEVFKSPASSISAESGIDFKYYSFRCPPGYNPRKQLRVNPTETHAQVPNDSNESLFTESYLNSITSNNKHDFGIKTPWEAVYAFRQGRKLVRPTFQGRVYNFLERPKGWKSFTYHGAILIATLGSLFLSVIAAVAEPKLLFNEILFFVEVIFVICLGIEYIARVWSAGCRSKYMGFWGRIKFIFKLVSFIDLAVTLSSIIVIIFGSEDFKFTTKGITGIRLLQILRVLRLDRECACWRLLASVIKEHRQEMVTALYIGFLGLVFSSYFMFLIEKDVILPSESGEFTTYADSLWWGVVTMMTIGYGDKVPQTWSGRLLACISAMVTVSFFALPAGILGSGFALKVQQQQRQKHFSRQIPAAANLIQTLWRCYAADKNTSIATWKIHVKSPSNATIKYNKTMAALRRRRPKYKVDIDKNEQINCHSYGEIAVNLEAPKIGLHQSRSVPDMMISIHDDLMTNNSDSSNNNKLNSIFWKL